jgi:hypothetical protein
MTTTAALFPVGLIALLLTACAASQPAPTTAPATTASGSPSITKLTTQDGAQFQICQLAPAMQTALQAGDTAAMTTLNARGWTLWTDGPWLGLPAEAAFKQAYFLYHAAWQTGDSDAALAAWNQWTGSCRLYGYLPTP